VENMMKISRLFRKEKYKEFKKNESDMLLDDYDEFNLL